MNDCPTVAETKPILYKEDFGMRYKIVALEAEINAYAGDDKIEARQVELKHTFAPGVYAREVFLPKGIVVVGKIHKHEHLNFISKGKVTVFTEAGGEEVLEAPLTMVSPAGTKRLVIAHEDTIWTTVHLTSETDLDRIEDVTIAKNYAELGLIDPIILIENKGE